MNPYDTPKEETETPVEKPRTDGGSLARILLGLSGFWWLLTGFMASPPGNLWGSYLIAAAFAALGLVCARNDRLRMIGCIFLGASIALSIMDVAEGKRRADPRKTRSSQGRAGESLHPQ